MDKCFYFYVGSTVIDICDKFYVNWFIAVVVTCVCVNKEKLFIRFVYFLIMSEIIQQRSSIKFCARNEISAAETFRMVQKAFGEKSMSRASVFDWHKLFKEGRERVEDEPHQRRPRTSTDELHANKIKELVLQNRRLTTRELADIVGISNGSVNTNNSWFLHHDNAPSHTALVLREYFAKNSTNIVPQPPYSPDLAPCDFWLFSKLKRPLRGHRFDSIEEIKAESKRELMAIPEDEYKQCFENWKKRWHSCIASGGDYFEGDDLDLEE